jgi:hypothetical protein
LTDASPRSTLQPSGQTTAWPATPAREGPAGVYPAGLRLSTRSVDERQRIGVAASSFDALRSGAGVELREELREAVSAGAACHPTRPAVRWPLS